MNNDLKGTDKSPEMEEALNKITRAIFKRERTGDVCVTCGSNKVKPEDFRDNLSRKEFRISKMCQACQDSVFNDDDDYDWSYESDEPF